MYALDIHFNALFLVYCGALGAPFYALIALAPELHAARDWFDERVPRRFAGGFVMACACAFGALWLSQIVPAILRGTAPVDVDTEGLMTNPVHVLIWRSSCRRCSPAAGSSGIGGRSATRSSRCSSDSPC